MVGETQLDFVPFPRLQIEWYEEAENKIFSAVIDSVLYEVLDQQFKCQVTGLTVP